MRKYIVGFAAGVLMTIGCTAYADEIGSMIGKAVDGTLPLLIEGKRASQDVIVIEGTSYLPVKSSGELLGYEASYSDGQVYLKKNAAAGSGSTGKTSIGTSSKDGLYSFKASFLTLNSEKMDLIEQDGEQYVPVLLFERYISNDGQMLTVTLPTGDQAQFTVSSDYSPGVDGYLVGKSVYIKLSALNLVAKLKSGSYYLERN